MFDIARTVAQLFRQMRAQERPLAELERVRGAYDLGMVLHSGRFETDGTPFQVHGLGVASIVSQLDAPVSVIAAAVLHNAYTTGDWGDGRGPGSFHSRRARLRKTVGGDVEALLTSLRESRADGHLDALLAGTVREADLDETDRWLVLLDLADLLDKWDDGRVAYSEPGRVDRELVEGNEDDVAAIATRLGGADFGRAFESAFARMAAEEIPDSLRRGLRYSSLTPPPSWQVRPSVRLLRRARPIIWRLRARWARAG